MRISKVMCEHMLCDEISYKKTPVCIDTETPVFSFAVEGDEYDAAVKCYRVIVSSTRDKAMNKEGDVWDSGLIYSSDIHDILYDGAELASKTTYYFRFFALCSKTKLASKIGMFTTGLLLASEWKCGFIGIPADKTPKFECEEADKIGLPAPYLRRSFEVTKNVVSAKAYATAYGVYELYVNGKKDESYVLAPEWTDYTQSLQYQYYDLTDKIQQGENVIGAIVGDGWFSGNIAIVGRNQYGDAPLGFMLNLTITYDDGTEDVIVTDGNWRGNKGAIVYTDNQTGEYYDARLEMNGWCAPGFDDSEWLEPIGVQPPKTIGTRLKASIGPQAKVMEYVTPIEVTTDKNGFVIVDMGQNMVGVPEIKIKGSIGQKIVFRFGEMLNVDGTLYTENLRSALQTDTYIMSGDENGEVFHPHFTFHGFRYIEISGLDYVPAIEDIKGCVIYSACERTGYIETSNAMVNKLFSNALWGQKGNFVGVPTDCPQRDERMGWTGDAQVFCRTACYNMDCYGFYDKYGEDLIESQKPNGAITDVVPHVKWNNGIGPDLVGNANAAWGDVMFIMPYTLYTMYGDENILWKYYDAMESYFKCLLGTTNGLLRPDFGYGDWLSIDDDTPKDVLSTAYFAYDAYLMYKISDILGKDYERVYYANMFEKISKAWRDAYMDENGIIKGDTQCCYILALKMKLLPTEQRARAAKHLVRTIERKNYHLSTGFVGVSYLLPILCDCGYSDIAYRLLLNDTYPSWGYSIKNGATTIWERWNSYTIENGFGDVGMNSFNHYSLGSVVEWMYAYMGGIRPAKPGFKEFFVRPYFTDKLDFVNVKYDSISGMITSSWKKIEGGYELTITVPVNTKAYVALDPEKTTLLTEAKFKKRTKGFVVSSGKYVFEYKA